MVRDSVVNLLRLISLFNHVIRNCFRRDKVCIRSTTHPSLRSGNPATAGTAYAFESHPFISTSERRGSRKKGDKSPAFTVKSRAEGCDE